MLSLLQACFEDNNSTIADFRLNNKPSFKQMPDCMHIACIEYDLTFCRLERKQIGM